MYMMRSFILPALLTGGLLLGSCKSTGDDPQMPPQPEQPKVAFVLDLAPSASQVMLSLQALASSPEAFVDLNNNGTKDAGEGVGTTATQITLPAGTSQVKAYGAYDQLDLTGLPVTAISGAGLADLRELRLAGTALGQDALEAVVAAVGLGGTAKPKLRIEEYRLDSRLVSFIQQRGIEVLSPEGMAIDTQAEALVLRLPAGVDSRAISYDLEGTDLWLDKNLNGQKDAGEEVGGGGALSLPANASGETIYLFHGKMTSFSLYQPSNNNQGSGGDEDEEEEEDEEGEGRALTASASSSPTVMLDASRARSLFFLEWGASLQLGQVNLRGAKELRNAELGANPVQTLVLPEESNLRVLKLRGSQLKSLDLTKQTHLQQLLFVRGALAQVSFGQHDELKQLTLSGNALESVTLPHLPVLTLLSLENNKLRTLQLSAEKNYDYLENCLLGDNQLEALDLTRLVKTKVIDLSRNPLTTLQLPRDLKELRVASTKLTKLDLNPQQAGGRSFIQKLDASDCAELADFQASQCSLLTEVMLARCPKLTPAKLVSALPKLQASGRLHYDQALTEAQRTALTSQGWTVLP